MTSSASHAILHRAVIGLAEAAFLLCWRIGPMPAKPFAPYTQQGQTAYRDPRERFTFSFPAEFGTASPGTNDGFGDRLAAVRFSAFSAGFRGGSFIWGGEAVLTRDFPLLDIQAAGGLYDSITLEALPEPLRATVVGSLRPLTAANLCRELGLEQHLDVSTASLATLSPVQKEAIRKLDQMRNFDPKMVLCSLSGDVVTFQKEVAVQAGSPRQHIYGAVRFLSPPYSTFQLIRGTPRPPPPAMLDQMADVVRSWRALR